MDEQKYNPYGNVEERSSPKNKRDVRQSEEETPELEEPLLNRRVRRRGGFNFTLQQLNKELKLALGEDVELKEEDFSELKFKLPEKPSFPYLIFFLALAKDFVDLVSLGFLGTFTNIIAFIFIRLYLIRKVGFIKRFLYRRYIFALILETVPWVNIIPQWSIFVLRAYAKESKVIDELLTSIEKLTIRYSAGKRNYRVIKHFI